MDLKQPDAFFSALNRESLLQQDQDREAKMLKRRYVLQNGLYHF